MFYWLTEKIILAHIYSTSAFLLLTIFSKSIRSKSDGFLSISNLILLLGLGMNLFSVGQQTIQCRIEQIDHLKTMKKEGYDFYYSRNCFSMLIWTIILGFAFQILFIYKRHRTKIWATIISILLLLILWNFETVYIFIIGFFRDFLPSSWSVYYDSTDRIWTIIFSVLYFVICWTIPLFKKTTMTK